MHSSKAVQPTLAAFRHHGRARPSLAVDLAEAQAVPAQLARQGIDLDTIGNDLLRAGLTQFEQADAELLALPA
jgi:transaldolase